MISYCNLASSSNGGRFVFQIISAWEVSSAEFIERLLNTTKQFTHDETLSLLSTTNHLEDSSTDDVCMPLLASFSLVCPLSLIRMKHPGRTINCKHVQCFDISVMCQTILSSFPNSSSDSSMTTLLMTANKQKASLCPVCGINVSITNLQIDTFFKEIIDTHPSYIDSVDIQRNLETQSWFITPNKTNNRLSSILSSGSVEIIDLTLTPDLDYSACSYDGIFIKKEDSISDKTDLKVTEEKSPNPLDSVTQDQVPPSSSITSLSRLELSSSMNNIAINNPGPFPNQISPLTPFVVESESDSHSDDGSDSNHDSDYESNNNTDDNYFNNNFGMFYRFQDDLEPYNEESDNNYFHFPNINRQLESQIISNLVGRFRQPKIARPIRRKNTSEKIRQIRLRHCSFDNNNNNNNNIYSSNCENTNLLPSSKRYCNTEANTSSLHTSFFGPNSIVPPISRIPVSGFSFEDPIIID